MGTHACRVAVAGDRCYPQACLLQRRLHVPGGSDGDWLPPGSDPLGVAVDRDRDNVAPACAIIHEQVEPFRGQGRNAVSSTSTSEPRGMVRRGGRASWLRDGGCPLVASCHEAVVALRSKLGHRSEGAGDAASTEDGDSQLEGLEHDSSLKRPSVILRRLRLFGGAIQLIFYSVSFITQWVIFGAL